MIALITEGCECGAERHDWIDGSISHEAALEIEAARSTPGCTCPGYEGAPGGLHDGYCALFTKEYEEAALGIALLEERHRLAAVRP